MALETGVATIADLNPLNPSASDLAMEGDDHIRLIKTALKNTFPNINSVVNATDEQLNFLVGVTSAIQAQFTTMATAVADLQAQIDKEAYKITMWPGTAASIPSGYSLCDGGAVSRTANPKLFAAIGTTYGAGDGSTTFNKPDLRGVVPRGLDGGRGLDTDRVLGSYQADAVLNHNHSGTTASSGDHNHTGVTDLQGAHTHTFKRNGTPSSGSDQSGIAAPGFDANNNGPITTSNAGSHTHSLTINNSGTHTHSFVTDGVGAGYSNANENRVKNLAVNFMIKLG